MLIPRYTEEDISQAITTDAQHGRNFAAISLKGAHTVKNSDAYRMNTHSNPISTNGVSVLAVLADGITGRGLAKKHHTGKYAAEKLVAEVPSRLEEYFKGENPTPADICNGVNRAIASVLFRSETEFEHIFRSVISQAAVFEESFYGGTSLTLCIESKDHFTMCTVGNSQPLLVSHDPKVMPIIPKVSPVEKECVGWFAEEQDVHIRNNYPTFTAVAKTDFGPGVLGMFSDGLVDEYYLPPHTAAQILYNIQEPSRALYRMVSFVLHREGIPDDKTGIIIKV